MEFPRYKMKKLKGKNCVITGAASGIGRSLAIGLAKEGMNLFISDIQMERLDDVKGDCTIEKSYIYDNGWKDTGTFRDEDIGKGMVVKVKEDCRLGMQNIYPEVPEIPE